MNIIKTVVRKPKGNGPLGRSSKNLYLDVEVLVGTHHAIKSC